MNNGFQAHGGRDWKRIALWLVAATAAYNAGEGLVAIWSGLVADSISLLGFGLDSFIELTAAGVLLGHLVREARGADPDMLARGERRVHRFIGFTFLALALYVAVEAGLTLWRAEAPENSLIGIVLAVISLLVMPGIAWGKLRAGSHIGSAALRAEAKETLACSYLSLVLLVGLSANATLGWWWADPIAALLMIPWLVREGLEGLENE